MQPTSAHRPSPDRRGSTAAVWAGRRDDAPVGPATSADQGKGTVHDIVVDAG